MHLRGAVDQYLDHAQGRLGRRTLGNRRSYFRQLTGCLGDLQLEELRSEDLDRYARQRLAAGVGPVTVNSELRAYRRLVAFVAERHQLALPRPALLRELPPLEASAWTVPEVRRLLRHLHRDEPAIHPLVLCIATTGMRRGEALALTWPQVDLNRRIIRLWPREDWAPKRGRPREVPISLELERVLRRLPRKSTYVFCSRNGQRWAVWPQRAFDRARAAAGLTGGPHRLRHSYATAFLERRPDLPLLAKILGHSDERVTRIYAHLLPGHLASARDVVSFSTGVLNKVTAYITRTVDRLTRLGRPFTKQNAPPD